MNASQMKKNKCPTCKGSLRDLSLEDLRKVYPFCSERCQKKDLANWLFEAYRVPLSGNPDSGFDELENSELVKSLSNSNDEDDDSLLS